MICIVALSIVLQMWNSADVKLPKFETGGIGWVLADQNRVMIVGAIVVSIIVLYLLRKSLGPILIVGGILVIAFIGYRYWDSVEDTLWKAKGDLDNATMVEFTVDSLKERSWKDILPSGRYQVRIRGDMYRYKCSKESKGSRSGYPEGARADGGEITGESGGILVWSSSATNNPQGNNGEFLVGENNTIFARFETDCPGEEILVQSTNVSVQFKPVKLK